MSPSRDTQPVADGRHGATLTQSRAEHIFPTLTPAQMARVAAHGHSRRVTAGEVLVEAGENVMPFFMLLSGQIEIVRPSAAADTVITVHHPGEFTGEANMLSGRRTLVRAHVIESGEVVELSREQLLALVQTDAE